MSSKLLNYRRIFALALAVVLTVGVSRWSAADGDTGWVFATSEAGISVSVRNDDSRSLPMFRGIGMVEASLLDILAVLDDTGRHTEWMANCAKAKVIRHIGEFDRVVYNRTASPWPVSDRDVVLLGSIEGSMIKREVWSHFRAVSEPGNGPIDGIVRMPRLKGFYHLQAVDDTHTRVTYQIDADPGGMLPDWLVSRATKRLPIDTIIGLRRQTQKMRGHYGPFLKKYDPAHGGVVPAIFAK